MTITLEAMPEVRRITPGNRLGLALFLAAVIHAIIIIRVGFGADLKAHVNPPSLDVVLARRAAHQAPKKADCIASANQQASESADTKLIPTRPVLGPAPLSTARVTPIAVRAAPTQTKSLERMRLMQTRADLRIADQQRHRPLKTHKIDNSRAGQSGNRAADLRTGPRRAALCKDPRVNYLETVSAKTAVEAAYIKAWIDKVERVGNPNYPDYARRRNLSARLILHVLPASDGSTVNAFISAFSEQKVLDNAALHIVKLAAPFKPFSTQMRKAYDQLMITRTGVFKSEGGLTTQ